MCDQKTKTGDVCPLASTFWVHVRVVPQTHTTPDGDTWTETNPAGRGNTVCSAHLARTVRELHGLEIRTVNAQVTVRPL